MSPARSVALPLTAASTDPGLLQEVAAFFRQFILAAFNPYRPERHYMRGPGPACRARERNAA